MNHIFLNAQNTFYCTMLEITHRYKVVKYIPDKSAYTTKMPRYYIGVFSSRKWINVSKILKVILAIRPRW